MAKKKHLNVFDVAMLMASKDETLAADVMRRVDELGYAMLAEQGYDVTGWDGDAEQSRAANERIKEEMERRGEWLNREGARDNEKPRFAVWLSLYRGKELVARSQVAQLWLKEESREKGSDS